MLHIPPPVIWSFGGYIIWHKLNPLTNELRTTITCRILSMISNDGQLSLIPSKADDQKLKRHEKVRWPTNVDLDTWPWLWRSPYARFMLNSRRRAVLRWRGCQGWGDFRTGRILSWTAIRSAHRREQNSTQVEVEIWLQRISLISGQRMPKCQTRLLLFLFSSFRPWIIYHLHTNRIKLGKFLFRL